MWRMKIISHRPAPVKHIPQRTCIACRQVKAKRELIRLVRTPVGKIEIDSNWEKAGRGAYLCRAGECWETGLKGNRLEHALRSNLTQDKREQLLEQAKDFLQGAN